MSDNKQFGNSEQLESCDHEKDHFADPGKMVGDLISRASAVNAICEDGTRLEQQGKYCMTMAERKQRDADILGELPSAQSSLYGYDLRNLIVFADAVNKKGISDSEIEDFVKNARAAWEYAWEEFQRTQREALDSIMRGDHYEG